VEISIDFGKNVKLVLCLCLMQKFITESFAVRLCKYKQVALESIGNLLCVFVRCT